MHLVVALVYVAGVYYCVRCLCEAAADFRRMHDIALYWERRARQLARGTAAELRFFPPHQEWARAREMENVE
jgi:hypothetical protein